MYEYLQEMYTNMHQWTMHYFNTMLSAIVYAFCMNLYLKLNAL